MATHKIAIKRPDGELETMAFEGVYRSDVKPLLTKETEWVTLQYVMLRQTPDGRCLCMVCDEDGRFKQLPYNFSMITQSGGYRFLSQVGKCLGKRNLLSRLSLESRTRNG